MAIELADKLYTSTQVADILGVSLRTLYRYMEDDKIKSMRTASGRHRFTKDHIIEFLNAGRMDPSDVVQRGPVSESPRNAGYANAYGDQRSFAPSQPSAPVDNNWAAGSNMPNDRFNAPAYGQQGYNEPARNDMYGNPNVSNNFAPQTSANPTQTGVADVNSDDDFEFGVTNYDSPSKADDKDLESDFEGNDDFLVSKNTPQAFRSENLASAQSPAPQQQTSRQAYAQDSFAPPASSAAQADRGQATGFQNQLREEPRPEPIPAAPNLNVRYYRSDYTDLIELAKKIKDTANSRDLEYAFTLYAGLSLHFLIRPFTVLSFYANPEDMQLWKDELRLVPTSNRDDANVGIIINTDIVFVPTKEIGGFKVVEDKVLLKDLSASNEEELVKQFRQHLTSI